MILQALEALSQTLALEARVQTRFPAPAKAFCPQLVVDPLTQPALPAGSLARTPRVRSTHQQWVEARTLPVEVAAATQARLPDIPLM